METEGRECETSKRKAEMISVQSTVRFERSIIGNGVVLNVTLDDPENECKVGSILTPIDRKDHLLKVKGMNGGITSVEVWCWGNPPVFKIDNGDQYTVTK